MNTKGKRKFGKSKSDKGESKAVIGVVLAAIMLASVFAGISASAVADNNTDNESVDDNVVVESVVEEEGVGASVHGWVEVNYSTVYPTPTENIGNDSATLIPILNLSFTAHDEEINITNMTIKEEGTIHVNRTDSAFTDYWGINDTGIMDEDGIIYGNGTFDAENGTALITTGGLKVLLATAKDLCIYVNITNCTLGEYIKLNLTSYNASGVMSSETLSAGECKGTPKASNSIFAAGTLNLEYGQNISIFAEPHYHDAGVNTSGIVISQLNFTATKAEGSTIGDVTLTENGTADLDDFSAVYLVNDTVRDGVWNSSATGSEKEPIITTKADNFSAENGTITLTLTPTAAKEDELSLGESAYYLVVVNTTKSFWAGETINVTVTNFNGTGDGGAASSKAGTGLQLNETTGQAIIRVIAGDKQPIYTKIGQGDNTNLEIQQLNFTVTAGKVDISRIQLNLNGTGVPGGAVYPKVYWDKGSVGDGEASSIDTALHTANLTLGSYNRSDPVANFTDGTGVDEGASEIYAYIKGIANSTGPWWYNVSVEYINNSTSCTANTTYFNVTNATPAPFAVQYTNTTLANGTYNLIETGTDTIYDITNITFVANSSVVSYEMDIIARVTAGSMNSTMGVFNSTSTANYTDGSDLIEGDGVFPLYAYNISWTEPETVAHWFNVSINYTRSDGTINQTYFNTSGGWTWMSLANNITEPAINIVNITNSSCRNATFSFSIVAPDNRTVTLDKNITIGSETETPAGYDSGYVVIAVNTTDDEPAVGGDTIKMEIMRNATAGKWIYTATDTVNSITLSDTGDYFTGNVITATTTVGNNNLGIYVGVSTPSANVKSGINTLLPVLQLNFTNNNPDFSMDVHSITIGENGTVNETMIAAFGLAKDSDSDGKIDSGEVVSTTNTTYTDNSSVRITPTTAIPVAKNSFQNVLVWINTTSNFKLNNTLWFNMTNPSIDCNVTIIDPGFGTINQSETTLGGNKLTAVGNFTASLGANNPDGRWVSAYVNETFVVLMQLNLSAPSSQEDVNVTNITVTWNTSVSNFANATTDTQGIGIINDTDADGVVDWDSGECVVNATTFTANTTLMDLYKIIPAGGTKSYLIYVNTTAAAANLTANEKLAINISNPSVDIRVVGNTTDLAINDSRTTEIASEEFTARTSGSISVTNLTLATDTFVEGAQPDFPLLRLNFTATNETVNINSIKIYARYSSINATNITNVGLVVDADKDGEKDAAEAVITLTRQNFTDNETYVTLAASPAIQVKPSVGTDVLVVADTSAQYKAGHNMTLALNNPSTDYDATGVFSVTRIQDANITTKHSTTTVIGTITVSSSSSSVHPITATAQNFVELLPLNFSATYEDANVTAINVTWIGSANGTNKTATVGVALDLNENGDFDLGELILNGSATFVNDTANITLGSGNVTLATYNQSLATNFTRNFNLSYPEAVSAHISSNISNATGWFGYYNLTIEYVNASGLTNTTNLNTSDHDNATCTWIPITAPDKVLSIVNVYNGTPTGNATTGTIDIIATTRLNVSDGSYAKAVIFVNTSGDFNVTDELQVNLTTYNATGISSDKPLTAGGVMPITSDIWKGTGNLTAAAGDNDVADTWILAGENSSIVVWQLNLTASEHENLTINNITVTENGTANGTADIDSIYLVNDTVVDGSWNVTQDGGIISDICNFGADNGTVIIPLNSNNTITNATSVNYLLVVNTTATFHDGKTLKFLINRSTTDGELTRLQGINATGNVSNMVVYNNFYCQNSNATNGYGSIDVYNTTQPTAVNVGAATNVAVLNLSFNATRGAIDIENITLMENGTANVNYSAGAGSDYDITNVSVWMDDTAYNTTANFTAENGSLIIETTTPQLVISSSKIVTIKVNTTGNLTAGETLFFEVNQTLGVGYNATGNVSSYTNLNYTLNGTINNTMTAAKVPPNITAIVPTDTTPSDEIDATRTFKVNVSQAVNVSWEINGTVVQTNSSVAANTWCNYTNTSAKKGVWNVSAVVSNVNGTDMQTWIWTVSEFSISLSSGWNLISLPIMPDNDAIESVTADIQDNLDTRYGIWAYNASPALPEADRWSAYKPGAPADLTKMTAGKGYWVRMNVSDTLIPEGTFFPVGREAPPTYKVYTGWNLIGFHATANKNASDYLSNLYSTEGAKLWSTLYKYTAPDGPYVWVGESDNMERGYGYWLSMKTDGEIIP